tara:strand:+ start:949 stop:1122 length:174 start_codon:yes stop_codon:yes gene_type:complete
LKFIPGIGDPLQLPIDEFNEYLSIILDHQREQAAPGGHAPTDHRSHVEQQMRKIHGV